MPIDFTQRGYIEVWRDGVRISQHNREREAVERITIHATENGNGDYEIRHPLVVAKAYGVIAPGGGDTEAPTAPGSVSAVATSATTGTVTWAASTDNVGVAGYQIFRDGAPLSTTTNLSFPLTGLSPSTQYSITVVAFDASGNNSSAGGPALFTTDANSAPVWSLGNQAYETGTAVSIALDSFCTDADADPITYSLVSGTLPSGLALSGARNQTLSGTVDTVETANFTLGASDGIAVVQNVALAFTITAPDTVAPAAPTGLEASGASASTVVLNWTDNAESDLSHYEVWRSVDGTSYGLRADNILVSSYTDSGLNSLTQYWYKVKAVDDSGNVSDFSSVVNQTTSSSGLASSTEMVVSLVASRTSGPAPLGVQFDAIDTTHVNGAVDTFRDIGYYFDYDDERGETWPNSSVANHSKNIDYGGPLGAHVFEVPGTYDVRVRARDATGEVEDAQVFITVTDPDVVYAGTDTICISTGTDFTDAPSGAQQLASQSSWPEILSGKRYLLKAGDDFQSFGTLSIGVGTNDTQIGKFGTGADPLISNFSMGSTGGSSPGTGTLRNTVYDIELTAATGGNGAIDAPSVGDHVQHTLFHRLTAQGQGAKMYFDGALGTGRFSSGLGVVEHILYNIVSECNWTQPRGATSNGVYALHATGGRLAVIGGEFSGTDGPIPGNGSHNIRFVSHYKNLVQHVRMRWADNDSHDITARAFGTQAWNDLRFPGGVDYNPQSQYLIIRKNRVHDSDDISNRIISVEPTNAQANALITDVIIEDNYRVGTNDPSPAGGEFINGAGNVVERGNTTQTASWSNNTSTHLTTILQSYPNLQADNDLGQASITVVPPR